MLIYYLTGYPPKNDTGGGGLANNSLITEGIRRGHNIVIYTEQHVPMEAAPDIYWVSNMNGRFSREYIQDATRNWTVPMVVQDDGYQNLCPQPTNEYRFCFSERWKYRGEYNATTAGNVVLDIHTKQPDEHMYYNNCRGICRYKLMNVLLSKCVANVCVSPMHASIWRSIFPQAEGKQVIVKPQIPVDMFPNIHAIPRRNAALYAGTIAKGKGYDNCMRLCNSLQLDLYAAGDIHHTIDRSSVSKWIGHVPYSSLGSIYNEFKYFIHLPDTWPEPQGRTITEALLSGCEVLTNWNVGALTYDWIPDTIETVGEYKVGGIYYRHVRVRNIEQYRRIISTASSDFWNDLSKYVEGV